MTDEQILKKAMEKANKNGFYVESYNFGNDEGVFTYEYYHIIFSHNFVEAFFSKSYDAMVCEKHGVKSCSVHKCYCDECGKKMKPKRVFDKGFDGYREEWQWHLERMVLEPKPLKYIEKFI